MSGLMGAFYRISEWVVRLIVTNLLWLFCNLPILYFTFNILFAPEDVFQESLFVNSVVIAILAPFIFFPSTAAAFSVARKWVMGDLDVPLVRTFFRGFKSNYKMSMLGGLIIVPLWALYAFDYYYYVTTVTPALSYLFLAIGLFLFAFTLHFLSMTVHFNMRLWQLFKNAAVISIGRPLISLGIVIVSGAIIYISLTVFSWMLPFFSSAIIAYVSFRGFYVIYSKAQQLRELNEEQEEEHDGYEERGMYDELERHDKYEEPDEHGQHDKYEKPDEHEQHDKYEEHDVLEDLDKLEGLTEREPGEDNKKARE